MRDKKKLTQELIKHLPESLQQPVEDTIPLWWHNLRTNGGMRLTKQGYETFTKLLELEHYEYEVDPHTITSRMIVELDRKLQHPWYVRFHKQIPRSVIFFGSKEAMMANLYGNIKKFLDNYH